MDTATAPPPTEERAVDAVLEASEAVGLAGQGRVAAGEGGSEERTAQRARQAVWQAVERHQQRIFTSAGVPAARQALRGCDTTCVPRHRNSEVFADPCHSRAESWLWAPRGEASPTSCGGAPAPACAPRRGQRRPRALPRARWPRCLQPRLAPRAAASAREGASRPLCGCPCVVSHGDARLPTVTPRSTPATPGPSSASVWRSA